MALWGKTDSENSKPKFLSADEKERTFGMDTTEITAGGDNVTTVTLTFAGVGYTEATHTATLSGGGGTGAEITYSGSASPPGTVTGVSVTNVGSGYTSAPTVTFGLPRRTLATNRINTTTNVISYFGHLLNAGDVVKYFNGGGTSATGLTDNTTYYVISSGLTANEFKVSATDGGEEVDISGTGNNAQYFEIQGESRRATAVTDLGYKSAGSSATHAGWVIRTVGTGRRAGRIQTETLVAMGSMTSDASDDTVLPDA